MRDRLSRCRALALIVVLLLPLVACGDSNPIGVVSAQRTFELRDAGSSFVPKSRHQVVLVMEISGVAWEEWDDLKDNMRVEFDDQAVDIPIRSLRREADDQTRLRLAVSVPPDVSEFALILGHHRPVTVRPESSILDVIEWE